MPARQQRLARLTATETGSFTSPSSQTGLCRYRATRTRRETINNPQHNLTLRDLSEISLVFASASALFSPGRRGRVTVSQPGRGGRAALSCLRSVRLACATSRTSRRRRTQRARCSSLGTTARSRHCRRCAWTSVALRQGRHHRGHRAHRRPPVTQRGCFECVDRCLGGIWAAWLLRLGLRATLPGATTATTRRNAQ